MQKKKEDCSAAVGLSASFYELNRKNRFFPGPALPIRFLVLTCGKHRSKKYKKCKLESRKDHRPAHCPALRIGEGRNGRTLSKLVVPWRFGQLMAPHAEEKAKEYREKFHTLEKKRVVERDFTLGSSILCESTFLQESVSTSALAPSLVEVSSVMTAEEEQV